VTRSRRKYHDGVTGYGYCFIKVRQEAFSTSLLTITSAILIWDKISDKLQIKAFGLAQSIPQIKLLLVKQAKSTAKNTNYKHYYIIAA
jgi:hypothetical protein